MRAVADEQILPDLNAEFPQALDFGDERNRIDDDSISDHANFAAPQNAGRNEVQNVSLTVVDHGVAGVIAALAAHDDVGVSGQDVDDFPLPFIPPLRADHNRVHHYTS